MVSSHRVNKTYTGTYQLQPQTAKRRLWQFSNFLLFLDVLASCWQKNWNPKWQVNWRPFHTNACVNKLCTERAPTCYWKISTKGGYVWAWNWMEYDIYKGSQGGTGVLYFHAFITGLLSLASKHEHEPPKHDLIGYQTWHVSSWNIEV